jgi:hypothetical protein
MNSNPSSKRKERRKEERNKGRKERMKEGKKSRSYRQNEKTDLSGSWHKLLIPTVIT